MYAHTHTSSLFQFASRGEWDLKLHSPLCKLCFSVSWVKRRRVLFLDMQPVPKIPESAGQTGCAEIRALRCFCDILLGWQAGNTFPQHFLTNMDTSKEGCLLEKAFSCLTFLQFSEWVSLQRAHHSCVASAALMVKRQDKAFSMGPRSEKYPLTGKKSDE